MNEDLYNALKEAGYYTKSYPEFVQKYGSPEGQKTLYDVLNSEQYYTKDFGTFQKKYFSQPIQNTPEVPQVATVPNDVQGEVNKQALGSLPGPAGALFNTPVLGDFAYGLGTKLASTITDQIPMGIEQAAAGSNRGTYEQEALKGKYPTLAKLKGLSKEEIYSKFGDANNDIVKRTIKDITGIGSNQLGFKEILDKAYELAGDNPSPEKLYSSIQQAYELNKSQFKQENLGQADIQQQEAQQKLSGVAQSTENINSPSSGASYVGNTIGQVLGLIPFTVATGSAGSFVLEKGEAYSNALEELQKSTGLTRNEILNQGLDKAAESNSDVSGLINAGLESASDLVILGKLIPKGAVTGLLSKIFTKNKIGSTLLTAGVEGTTELLQQLDTQLSAKVSAGKSLSEAMSEIGWKDLKEDFYGGLIGGGGVSLIIPGAADTEVKSLNTDINQAINEAELDADVSTGNTQLDASLDNLALESAKYADAILSEVENIEGNKLEEELTKAQEVAQAAISAKDIAEREALIATKANEFNQATAYPLSQAAGTVGPELAQQEELRNQEEIGQQPITPEIQQPIVQDDSENIQRVPSEVGTRKEPVLAKSVKRASAETVKASRVLQAPKKVEKAQEIITKPIPKINEAKIEEDRIKLEDKYTKQLENAAKRKPGARLALYEKIAEKANEVGLQELSKKADKLSQKEYELQQAKAEDKEMRKKHVAPKETKEARAARLQIEKEQKIEKQKSKAVNKEVVIPKGVVTKEETKSTIQKAKEKYFDKIAEYVERGDGPKMKAAIEEYKEFRKANGLKEATDADIKRGYTTEAAITKAKRNIKEAGRQKTRDRKSAKEAAKKDIAQSFGLNPEDIENFDLQDATPMGEVFKGKLKNAGLSKLPKEEISFDTYKSLASKSQGGILDALHRVVNKYKSKENSGTKFYKVTVPTGVATDIAGFHFSISKSDNSYIAILVDEATGRPILESQGRNTVLHEYLHEYTKLMFHRLYTTNKNFRDEIVTAFKKVKSTTFAKTKDVLTKVIKDDLLLENLSKEDLDLYLGAFNFLNDTRYLKLEKNLQTIYNEYKESKGNKILLSKNLDFLIDNIYRDFYAFTNEHELMAEIFSDPGTAQFLSLVMTDEKIKEGIHKGERKSLLYRWYEDLIDWTKRKFEHIGFDQKTKKDTMNAMEYFLDTIASFDDEFVMGNLERQSDVRMLGDDVSLIMELEGQVDVTNFDQVVNKAKKLNKKIISNISKTLEQRDEIQTENDVKAYIDRVNKNLPKNKQLGDVYTKLILKKINRLRKERVRAKKAKVAYVDVAKGKPEYKTSKKFKQDVDDFDLVNIDDLTPTQVGTYLNGLAGLAFNATVSKPAYDIMINFGKKPLLMKNLLPLASKINKDFLPMLGAVSNPATFVSAISKYKSDVSNGLLGNIYGGMMKAMTNSTGDSHKFFADLSTYSEKELLKHNDLVRVGMIGSIFSTRANPQDRIAWEKEISDNAKFTVDAAANKITAKTNSVYKGDLSKDKIQKELEIAKELQAAISKTKDITKILDKKQLGVYNKIRDFASKNEEDFKRNSVGIWGNDDYESRFNYFPTMAQGKDIGGDWNKDELIKTNSDNLFDALGRNEDYSKIYGKKANANNKRVNPKGYFYEFDALAIAKRWASSTLFDTYASTELKTMNRIMEDPKFVKEFGVKTRDAFKRHLKSISGVGNKYNDDSGQFAKAIMKSRDKLYTATLATSGQILLQSSSGVAAAAVISANVNPAKAMKVFAKAVNATMNSMSRNETNKLRQFIEKEGLGIQLRDILFEKYLTPEDYRGWLAANKLTAKAENATEWALRSGDQLGARIVWWAAYFNAGGTLENPTRAAILDAERMVGIMQNMSDLSFSAPWFKYDVVWKKLIFGMFYAFKSFSINSYVNLLYSTKYSLNNSEARLVAAAQLGSVTAYHAMAIIAVRPIYNAISSGINEALGGDDDDQEKRYSKVDSIIAESAWDIAFGMYTPSVVDAALRWAFNAGFAEKIYGPEYEEFDQYLDSPIHSVKREADIYKELMGPGYQDVTELGIEGLSLIAQQAAADEFFEDMSKTEKREFDTEMYYWALFGTIVGTTPTIPLRGDLKRVIESVIRKKKSQYYEEHKDSGGSNSGGPGESGDIDLPAYEPQEYEINNRDLDLP